VVGGRDTLHFRERFTSKMVSCPETADHPDQGSEDANKPLRQAQKLTRPPPVRRRTRPVTTAEQLISYSDPPGYVGDRLCPGHQHGLDKRQTTLGGDVTGLIRGFGRGKEYFVGGKEVSTHS